MASHGIQTTAVGGADGIDGRPPRNWLMGAEAFAARMPHHDGIKALWETKWKFPCLKSLYPFHDGAYEDFEPIFEHLIKTNVNDPTSPHYTLAFLPTADRLVARARATLGSGGHNPNDDDDDDDEDAVIPPNPDPDRSRAAAEASALYLRACAVYRIARFPYIAAHGGGGGGGFTATDSTKWRAWEAQKEAYRCAAALWECPVREELVEHVYGEGVERERGIPVYVRFPKGGGGPWPVVVLMTGLDGYRPDNTARCDEFLKRGWASVVVEIPGTADCPADSADPEAPDRLWTSLLEWMGRQGPFDMRRVMVWGLSSGGYYAVRVAHTHKDRLVGCVAQGAGCHYFYDREWLAKVDGHEYPFRLTPAMAMKHGFGSVDEYVAKAQKKFSLLEAGIIQKPSTRLLLVNGTRDGLMPIEDSIMLFEHGTPKEGRFFADALHMGYPDANASVYPWMEQVMASVRD